jgi:hypothetical protein
VITCLSSVSAIAQTYYADTVAGPMTDRPSRILQTNSAGTDVFVFDPDTMEQVGYIPNLPHNHGATVHADGTFYYFTNEHEQTVDVVNTRTFEVEHRIQLANGPHNLSASMRARKVYVAIIAEPLIQVIDMDSHEVIANIETGGGVHNTFVTPDGRYAVGGMIGASEIIAIDTETDEVLWEMSIPYTQKPFTGGVRPIAFTTNDDGSTRSLLVNVGGWHGFWEIDWDTQQVTNKSARQTMPGTGQTRQLTAYRALPVTALSCCQTRARSGTQAEPLLTFMAFPIRTTTIWDGSTLAIPPGLPQVMTASISGLA